MGFRPRVSMHPSPVPPRFAANLGYTVIHSGQRVIKPVGIRGGDDPPNRRECRECREWSGGGNETRQDKTRRVCVFGFGASDVRLRGYSSILDGNGPAKMAVETVHYQVSEWGRAYRQQLLHWSSGQPGQSFSGSFALWASQSAHSGRSLWESRRFLAHGVLKGTCPPPVKPWTTQPQGSHGTPRLPASSFRSAFSRSPHPPSGPPAIQSLSIRTRFSLSVSWNPSRPFCAPVARSSPFPHFPSPSRRAPWPLLPLPESSTPPVGPLPVARLVT